ncbi:MAG: NAD-dependent epimerase/dehydratase family protein, partial [Candidatus Helarchaeota archaeon]
YLWEKYDKGQGLPISIIRPPSVFGPHDRANFTDLLALIKHDRALVPGKGDQVNSWVYTYDIADLLLKMAEDDRATGEAFNVKTGDLTSIELIEKLAELLNITDLKIRHIPIWLTRFVGLIGSGYGKIFRRRSGPLIHRQTVRMVIHHHSCNIDKAKHLLDWAPKYSLDNALRQTIDWFIESGRYDSL